MTMIKKGKIPKLAATAAMLAGFLAVAVSVTPDQAFAYTIKQQNFFTGSSHHNVGYQENNIKCSQSGGLYYIPTGEILIEQNNFGTGSSNFNSGIQVNRIC